MTLAHDLPFLQYAVTKTYDQPVRQVKNKQKNAHCPTVDKPKRQQVGKQRLSVDQRR